MKKIMSVLLVVAMCLVIVACDSSDYKKAEELYAAGDYAAALEIYTALGEYEDSQNKAQKCMYEVANAHFEKAEYKAALEIYTELGEYEDAKDKAAYCEREVGMTENADYAFLADIEKSLLGRMEATKTENFERDTIVNTELAYVEKYADKTFYDANLKAIAEKYIEGLKVQKEALKKESKWEYQIEWQKGIVLRYEALNELYKNYDFLTDNADFIGTYIADLEDQQHILNGYNAIEADLTEQMTADDFQWKLSKGGYNIYCTLKNNTEYTFGLFIDVSFYDSDKVLFETNTGYVEEVKPGESYVLEVYISDADRVENFGWTTYYDYVK
ncbi:MAG: tetratricopeptide repeat protein [Clostridia bacterium]|nr:tetratricopeptide repeat protein [Clostridia bacterium]